ncbi:hypothetical protein HD806DRAFT_548020 [Xylariaceae sp. AK1471]|nr:hypothetical protein HD806DRAFT_548020 [Xylariaceae sp. AK1471]
MGQNRRLGFYHSYSRRCKKQLIPHIRVWYCCECGFGPWNLALHTGCASCGKQQCKFCSEEWVPLEEKSFDISTARNQEPHLEALPTSNIPHSSSRAAIPFVNTGSATFDFGLTSSPLPPLLHQSHVTGTQSETQSCEAASEVQNVRECENDLVPVPIYEPFHDQSWPIRATNDNTRSLLARGSPQHPDPVSELANQFISDSGLDHPVQYAGEAAGLNVESFSSHQVEPTIRIQHRPVAIDIAINASAVEHSVPNSDNQSGQACSIPVSSGTASDAGLSEWLELPTDVSRHTTFLADSQIQSFSIGPTALQWSPDDDNAAPSRPPLSPVDYGPLEAPASTVKSVDNLKPTQNDKATKRASRHYECCGSDGNQRFACLFYKFDPIRHFHCAFKSFDSIGHLRPHLDKSHRLGPNHCKSCWQTFNTADSLINHLTTQDCRPTGGISVDDLPGFPRIRWPMDEKWYWGWKKLFGEAAALPQCPFYHPMDDLLSAQLRAQNPEPSELECIRRDGPGKDGSPSYPSFADTQPHPNIPYYTPQ